MERSLCQVAVYAQWIGSLMFDPPSGLRDLESDGEFVPGSEYYLELNVPEVGTVAARKPVPNAIHALAMAANADIEPKARADYLVLFAQNHLNDGEMDRLLEQMVRPDSEMPGDTIERVVRAITTWGTARPTVPLSRSVR